jgi:hypothetical protein
MSQEELYPLYCDLIHMLGPLEANEQSFFSFVDQIDSEYVSDRKYPAVHASVDSLASHTREL